MEQSQQTLRSLSRAFQVFRQDLEALPEDVFDRHLGGKARTVADIAYEVNLVNDDVAASMRGEPSSDWPEGWQRAPDGLKSKQSVLDALGASSAKILSQVGAYSEEDLMAPVTTEHGETTRQERCRFMVLHMWYHSGQLNFIQTLLGEDAWHWG
ncbi:MAG: DinB family protein [Fimbriimonadaceae bacterium]|nr:DinB family protein [Fimbriimonadaceae bacterium]QYK54729.1 MAG: DinB family protein [Fimbriimonadaceae bacterium]